MATSASASPPTGDKATVPEQRGWSVPRRTGDGHMDGCSVAVEGGMGQSRQPMSEKYTWSSPYAIQVFHPQVSLLVSAARGSKAVSGVWSGRRASVRRTPGGDGSTQSDARPAATAAAAGVGCSPR